MTTRCEWAEKSPQLLIYHDLEWGVPVRSEQQLFENLCLEIFQAGLTWETVLKYRSGLRAAFYEFDVARIATMSVQSQGQLYANPTIIKNRAKIDAVVENARVLAALHDLDWSLVRLFWAQVHDTPLDHHLQPGENPAIKLFVDTVSQTLKLLGFKRIGPRTVYSTMQASGMVNDHFQTCYRHQELALGGETV
ncbi:DNA-3-methyladenine glycosylase I [uncultured Secundilactobacillus sp.]|uniref:DNA-3-methyladenine glycosylase I n=1 Tax=uncultured Secundilactobacillus sp. TaxID=2813935 RepID=UPI0025909153|nr:DNA-3-methyladenine glycosylase I [uncultured Secundilactobacillus sp.]